MVIKVEDIRNNQINLLAQSQNLLEKVYLPKQMRLRRITKL
jgi:hypothetical protein